MANSDFADFYGRVTCVKKACLKEYGFEASGTLGCSFFAKPSRRSGPILGPLVFLLGCGFLMKSVMYQQIGKDSLKNHMAHLRDDE